MPHSLDPIFHPRAVAVVGVSSKPSTGRMRGFFHSLQESGFAERGGLYPVNPKVEEVEGVKCYPTLLDTPDPVDHVISQVPASAVSDLVDQCVEKKIRSIHFFTAGFSETGDEEMAALEEKMVKKLKDAGIRVIGPNCMGMYVPASRLAFMDGFTMESGNVFLASQSGANAGEIVHELTNRGIRFSKVVSYGNGSDLRAHHFLDYAADDPETEVVACYVEGVQDGRLFFDALKRCALKKKVVVLKGGRTKSGSNAAHSHTGSLAGSIEVFDAVCRQAGALRAETMEELQDLVVAISTNTCDITGTGVALFGGGGGGFAVLSSDIIDRAGLNVPRMPESAIDEMREFIPVAGSSVNNPIDAFPPAEHLDRMLKIVATAEGMDMLFMSPLTGWPDPNADEDEEIDPKERAAQVSLKAAQQMRRLQDETGTPVVGIVRSGRMARMMGISMQAFLQAAYREGIGSFPSVARASHTIVQILEWREYRKGLPDIF